MDPETRFRFLERLAADRLLHTRDDNGNHVFDDYDYMSSVIEAARVCGIDELTDWDMPARSSDKWEWICRNFRADATRISQRILFEHASRPVADPNTVALDPKTKEKLRFHLAQVRGVIDKDATMPHWKKEELYKAISDLEREIEKVRTPLTAVIDVLGKVLDGDETIRDAIRKVFSIIQEAKATEKVPPMLPPPVAPKQIEAAPKVKTRVAASPKKKNGFEKSLDDEIPF
jgi:hypothetical protein